MKRNVQLFHNPFSAWLELAMKMTEMSIASAQVIAHRTSRMAAAGPKPSARDRVEFKRMGQEKIEAVAESARAVATHANRSNVRAGMHAYRQMLASNAALISLAASRTPAQFFARQAKLAKVATRSAVTTFKYSGSSARLAKRALAPVHSRATANARRLAKR